MIHVEARFVSNTIYARPKIGMLNLPKLWMFFHGLCRFIRDSAGHNYNQRHRVNFGVLLTHDFRQVQNNMIKSTKKFIFIGSLVTHIIEHCGIEIPPPTSEGKRRFIDCEHLICSEILVRHHFI